jgi:6-phosphogluconolactonase (cycloisomerase 2 family)
MSDSASWLAYVGTRTTRERNAIGRGIAVYRVDAGASRWAQLQVLEGLRNPSYLCTHPTQPRLYAVHGDGSEVSTFAIAADGRLSQIAQQDTRGRNPVHLALTPSMRWLLVANYASGNVVALRVAGDGALGAVAHELKLPGEPGPQAQQDGSHPHQVCFSPDGRFALVPDKGLDAVFSLAINEDTGHLRVAAVSRMPRGSGPRHMAFHARLPVAYVVGELDRTVTTAHYDAATGVLTPMLACSTVPEGEREGSAAGVAVTSDSRHLIVSNRGHDSVAVFPLDDAGQPRAPAWIAAGTTPRFITFSPADASLVVAREDGHAIASLHGLMPPFIDQAHTGSPVCVVFRKANP